MSALLVALILLFDFWVIAALVVGVIGYVQLGMQPRTIGWSVAIITEVIALKTLWLEDTWVTLSTINLALIAVVALYFQHKEEEESTGSVSETMSFEIEPICNRGTGEIERFVGSWLEFFMSIYSVWAIMELTTSWVDNGGLLRGTIFAFSSVATTLLYVRFKGGSKGKLWKTIREAFKAKISLFPRPTSV